MYYIYIYLYHIYIHIVYIYIHIVYIYTYCIYIGVLRKRPKRTVSSDLDGPNLKLLSETECPKVKPFIPKRYYLGGGFKYFLFSSLFGEDSHFD